MNITELDTFVKKFHQLWNDGLTAHLDLDNHAGNAWVGLRVQLGHVPGPLLRPVPPSQQEAHQKVESPSRQRRRARRAAAQKEQENAGKVKETVAEKADSSEIETAEEVVEKTAVSEDEVEEVSVEEIELVNDEVCPDQEYETSENSVKSICSVQIYPKHYKLDGLKSFRDTVEEYFKKRKDVIKRVIKCEVENYGNNIKLVVEVNVDRGWAFFFFDSEENYGDLEGIKTVRHACKDLSKCDKE